jgi:hypothetical protein
MPRGEEAKRGGKRGSIGARVDGRSQLQRDKGAWRAEMMEGRWNGRWPCWWRKDVEREARLFGGIGHCGLVAFPHAFVAWCLSNYRVKGYPYILTLLFFKVFGSNSESGSWD